MDLPACRITDRQDRWYLPASRMIAGGLVSPKREGTPQGGPMSPLLSDVLLTELDRNTRAPGMPVLPLRGPWCATKEPSRAQACCVSMLHTR